MGDACLLATACCCAAVLLLLNCFKNFLFRPCHTMPGRRNVQPSLPPLPCFFPCLSHHAVILQGVT